MSDAIEVMGLGPVWGTPSASPFVMKLLSWLVLAGIEHRLSVLRGPPKSRSGKIPYVRMPNGQIIEDSSHIIATLTDQRAIALDADLDAEQLETAEGLKHRLEGSVYFAGLFERWITDEGFACTSVDYVVDAPRLVRWAAPRVLRRQASKTLKEQGFVHLDGAAHAERANRDLEALSASIGAGPFVFGDRPHGIDALAGSFLWAFRSHPFGSALREAIESDPLLDAYVDRFRDTVWPTYAARQR